MELRVIFEVDGKEEKVIEIDETHGIHASNWQQHFSYKELEGAYVAGYVGVIHFSLGLQRPICQSCKAKREEK